MNFLYALIAIFIFGMFDYVGYNKYGQFPLKKLKLILWEVHPYRVIQTLFQLGLFISMWIFIDFWAGFLFMFMWWAWLADFVYYLYYDVLKWFGEQGSAGEAFKEQVLGNRVTWASWTPYGIIFRWIPGYKKQPISGKILIIQGIVGLIISIVVGVFVKG
jgi:hypothetical protein